MLQRSQQPIFLDDVRLESKACTEHTKIEITVPVEVVWLVCRFPTTCTTMKKYKETALRVGPVLKVKVNNQRGCRKCSSNCKVEREQRQTRRQVLILSPECGNAQYLQEVIGHECNEPFNKPEAVARSTLISVRGEELGGHVQVGPPFA